MRVPPPEPPKPNKDFIEIQRQVERKRQRREIATAAMQGLLSDEANAASGPKAIAKQARIFADALIAELEKA